jgi:hypothetical protein
VWIERVFGICGLLWLVLGFLGIALVFLCCLLAFRAENAIFFDCKSVVKMWWIMQFGGIYVGVRGSLEHV